MSNSNVAVLRTFCRFDEKEGCYYLRLGLYQEEGSQEADTWCKNIDALVLSPNFKVNPLRSGFLPEEDGYKTKDFKVIPRNKKNPSIEILLLVANQAIYNHFVEDISKLV